MYQALQYALTALRNARNGLRSGSPWSVLDYEQALALIEAAAGNAGGATDGERDAYAYALITLRQAAGSTRSGFSIRADAFDRHIAAVEALAGIPSQNDFAAMRRIAERCRATQASKGFPVSLARYEALSRVLESHFGGSAAHAEVLFQWRDELALTNGVNVIEELALVASELGEAVDAYRHANMHPQKRYSRDAKGELHEEYTRGYDPADKPEGFASEIVDQIVRLMNTATAAGLPWVEEFERKMRYNDTRPVRHGGKRL